MSAVPRIGLVALLALSVAQVSSAQQPAQPAPATLDIDALSKEAAELLSQYIRVNSSNPPGSELATAKWLQATLAKEGIEGEILDTAELGPGRANFDARIKGSGANPKASEEFGLAPAQLTLPLQQKL